MQLQIRKCWEARFKPKEAKSGGGGGGGGDPGFKGGGGVKGFFIFEIFDFRICLGRKILASIFWAALFK